MLPLGAYNSGVVYLNFGLLQVSVQLLPAADSGRAPSGRPVVKGLRRRAWTGSRLLWPRSFLFALVRGGFGGGFCFRAQREKLVVPSARPGQLFHELQVISYLNRIDARLSKTVEHLDGFQNVVRLRPRSISRLTIREELNRVDIRISES